MQENNYFVLPEKLSIENVSTLFKKIKKQEEKSEKSPIEIDFKNVKELDSSAIALLNYLKRNHAEVSFKNVTPEFDNLLAMFPLTKTYTHKPRGRAIFGKGAEAAADKFLSIKQKWKDFLVLLADEISYTFQFLMKRRGIYPGEIFNQLFLMGYKSFPIVSLISFLVGVTIALTAAEQLRNFGAEIYLADLVGFGMVRELVPLMTGIILAGKIGASIAAEISSMKVLEETDALKTMGIIPEKFLMVPRLIAISLAIPLLVTLADFIGIFAGVLVAHVVSGIPPEMFFTEMFTVVDIGDFMIGQMKTLVFGWIVVISSGYKGFSVKRGAAGVGIATTEAVVLSISLIIIFDCIFALLLY